MGHLVFRYGRENQGRVYSRQTDMSPANRRAIRKIIFENLEYLVSEYEKLHHRGA